MIKYEDFNREAYISVDKGRMTEKLGAMVLEMCWATTSALCVKYKVHEITGEEIYGNVVEKFVKKFLDKVDVNAQPYAFAIVMVRNLAIDQLRRLSYSDPLLSPCTTYVAGEKMKANISYIEDLVNNQ